MKQEKALLHVQGGPKQNVKNKNVERNIKIALAKCKACSTFRHKSKKKNVESSYS